MQRQFKINPRSVESHVPAATYARGLQIYLNQGVLDHVLEPASASEWHVDGMVRGSEPRPYDTSVTMEVDGDGLVHSFASTCSCAVGSYCKHAVALALKAAYASVTQRSNAAEGEAAQATPPPRAAAQAAPTAPAQPPTPRAVAEVNRWLNLFDKDTDDGSADDTRDDVAPTRRSSPDVALYLLSEMPRSPRGPRTPPRLHLAWKISRPLKRGGWARPKPPSYDAWYTLPALASNVPNDDQECIRLVQSMAGERHSYGQNTGGAVQGTAGMLALQIAARTGRLFATDAQGEPVGEPLRWGAPRPICWHWSEVTQARETDPLWTLQATAQPASPDAPAARAYGSQPALYLDIHDGSCGPLAHDDISPAQLHLLMSAPPIPQSTFGDANTRLLERLAGLPLPPTVEPPAPWPCTQPPTVHLRLLPVPRAERGLRGLLCAMLEFDYAGLRGFWGDRHAQQAHLLVQHEGRRVLLHRDLALEGQARAQLQSMGLECDALSRFHTRTASTWLEWGLLDWAPLRDAGFAVEADAALRGFVQQADDLQVDMVAPQPRHPQDADGVAADTSLQAEEAPAWFDLSLGIAIDGKRHNVLPWLPGLLAQVRQTPEGPQMPPWLWREQPDGTWLRLPSAPLRPWLQALLELVGERPERDLEAEALRLSRLEALRAGLMLGEGAVWEGTAGLRDTLRTLLGGGSTLPAVAVPAGLQAQLRPYQQQGLEWLQFLRRCALGGILADDMGLGKTLQTLAHLLRDHEDGVLDRPSLVIAPVSLLGNWRREAARFAPDLRTRVWHGTTRHRQELGDDCDLVIAPYSLLQRDRELWQGRRWHLVVLDEAQNIKNATSQAAQVVHTLDARQRLCLTGTPMENHLGELWSLFHFLMPGFLGSQARFREVFRVPIEKHADTARLAQLRQRVTPFMLRRTKSAVATELPDRIDTTTAVTLDGAQADLYETIRLATEKAVREALEGRGLARSQIQVLDALLKLRQVCCDPRLVRSGPTVTRTAGSAKLDVLMEMLPELLDEGRRVLLFSQFTSMLELIEERLRELGMRWVKLTGQTQQRDEVITRFTSGEVPLFLISLKAGGTGLNLPEADTVIHYDPWWNPAVEEQATARAHRIGQTRQVMVYKLVAEGTIEERILGLQARKAALAQGLLHGAAAREAPLFTEDDVAELLRPIG